MSGNTDEVLQREFPQQRVSSGDEIEARAGETPTQYAFDSNKPTIDQTRKDAIDSIRLNFQALIPATNLGSYMPISGGAFTGVVQGRGPFGGDAGSPPSSEAQWLMYNYSATDWAGSGLNYGARYWFRARLGFRFWSGNNTSYPILELRDSDNLAIFLGGVYCYAGNISTNAGQITAALDGQGAAGPVGIMCSAPSAGNMASIGWGTQSAYVVASKPAGDTNALNFTFAGSTTGPAKINCGLINTGRADPGVSSYSIGASPHGTIMLNAPCTITTYPIGDGSILRLFIDCTNGVPTFTGNPVYWPNGIVPAWQSGPIRRALVALMWLGGIGYVANVSLY